MKLATIRNGTRDGALALVSSDLTTAALASDVVAGLETMQQLLDEWGEWESKVERVASELEDAAAGGRAKFPITDFDPAHAMAPLPRAYAWADGSAYVNHVELVRKARNAEMPASFWTDPLMYQGGSDTLLGGRDDIVAADEAYGIDLEGELAVITGDVPMGVSADDAGEYIRFVMLVNDVSLRNLVPSEVAKGFGLFHCKPSTAFSPVAVTPDELGSAWRDGKVHLPLEASINGTPLGRPVASTDMTFNFPRLIAHAAKTRKLSAGTIIGSGTVSNRDASGGPGRPIGEGGLGYTCLAELRTVEMLLTGKATTPFLRFGDRVTLDMRDGAGQTIFGTIDQRVVKYAGV